MDPPSISIQNRRDPCTWRLEFMSPKALHFILEEMLAWAPAPVLARHRYGCRVLDRLRVTTRFFKTLKLKPSQNFFCTMKPQLSVFLPGQRFELQLKWSPQHLARNPTHPQPNLATETPIFTNMKYIYICIYIRLYMYMSYLNHDNILYIYIIYLYVCTYTCNKHSI